MAKGQVIETLKQRDLGISEADYYRIISLKTAVILCCLLYDWGRAGRGLASATCLCDGLRPRLGMAFQMADDTLDFVAPEARLGKPVNNDLKEGKITLPIIAAHETGHCARSPDAHRLLANG